MQYYPYPDERYFAEGILYSTLHAATWNESVNLWRDRIREWYIEPLNALRQVHSFPMILLECTLIDMLSQFYPHTIDGQPNNAPTPNQASDSRKFIGWTKANIPEFRDRVRCRHGDITTIPSERNKPLTYYADFLWHGFRCGIVHQAHASPYCINIDDPIPAHRGKVVWTTETQFTQQRDSLIEDVHCPTVAVNPLLLRDKLVDVFDAYVDHKLMHANDRRACELFRAKAVESLTDRWPSLP